MTVTGFIDQKGQAMTEFVVAVSYVFLGLFVIVPMFGKLMDLQYQNQQASRYVAWERTVWFDPSEPIGLSNHGGAPSETAQSAAYWESIATRNDSEIVSTMENRFFYGAGPGNLKPITDDDAKAIEGELSPIWDYVQTKDTMYGGTTVGTEDDPESDSYKAEETPSIAYDVINFIGDGLETISTPIRVFTSAVGVDNEGLMNFDYKTRNYFRPVVTTQVNKGNSKGGGTGVWDRQENGSMGSGIEDVLFSTGWDGKLSSRSAILADGWNTQSLKHYQQQADDFVPSTIFDNDIFDAVITVASIMEGGPSNSAVNKLDFGAVGIEPMPAKPESEGGGPMEVTEGGGLFGGFYFYDE